MIPVVLIIIIIYSLAALMFAFLLIAAAIDPQAKAEFGPKIKINLPLALLMALFWPLIVALIFRSIIKYE